MVEALSGLGPGHAGGSSRARDLSPRNRSPPDRRSGDMEDGDGTWEEYEILAVPRAATFAGANRANAAQTLGARPDPLRAAGRGSGAVAAEFRCCRTPRFCASIDVPDRNRFPYPAGRPVSAALRDRRRAARSKAGGSWHARPKRRSGGRQCGRCWRARPEGPLKAHLRANAGAPDGAWARDLLAMTG